MALTLQIKRSTGSTAPGALADGELAYTHGNEKFYIGDGSTVKVIGGKYYNDLIDHTAGTLTASSAVLVDSNKAIDEILVGNHATTGGQIKLNEGTNNGTHFVGLKAPNALGGNVTFTLPTADGNANEFLKTDGSGALSFGAISTSFTLAADSGSDDSFSTSGTLTFTGGAGIDTTVSNDTITIAAELATETNAGVATFDGTDFTVTSGDVTVNAERVQDIAGAMFSSNTETRITATYQDSDGTVDLVVDDDLANYSNSNSGFITASSTDTLTNKTINGSQLVDGSVTNAKLAGSIANGKLANSTVSYGGVSLALGATDATPAFDLSDATNYPTSSLTGTITNSQLAGSIANSKLANDGITIGSDDTSLGGTITDLNGLTSVDVDNITLDANTISTTNSNGNLVLSPNGTGSVTVPSGYEGRAGFSSDSLVNKTYVDSVANGLDVKASVRVATTANLAGTYNNGAGTITAGSNGAISIDGVTLTTNDRVLVKDQSTGAQNGFYKVTTVGSGSAAFVLTRTPDADAASELTAGAFTFVEEGTANADNGYVLSTNGAITLGTTAITFEQFSGAGQISAGNGLTKTGNTIDVVGTADKITVSANALTIASTYVGQSSITTLGTITTGVWNGTAIAATSGGTGLSSIAKGSVLVANSANTLSALDGGGSNDGLLLYTASSDTLSFATSIDGGTF